MPKSQIAGWALLDVEMDEAKKTFIVKRRLDKKDLHNPNIRPTFAFLTSTNAQLIVNDHGTFLIRYKFPKNARGNEAKRELLKNNAVMPRLYTPPRNLKRLCKNAMRQLFSSGKFTIE